jgi:hypothetical protein
MVDRWSIATLRCVYPPVSNQEAAWLQQEADVEAIIRTSHFYAIAGRKEAFFRNFRADHEAKSFSFELFIGDERFGEVSISIDELPDIPPETSVFFRAGEKIVQIWDREPPMDPHEASSFDGKVIHWWTTEKLLSDLSHKHVGLQCDFETRLIDAMSYDLLYVGIATKQDTFTRLLAAGHKARMEILTNEPQRHPGARVTDEIYLFFFGVDALLGRSVSFPEEIPPDFLNTEIPLSAIIADAEKAFVHLTRPAYNEVKFLTYPHGRDGLYNLGFDGYSYAIADNIRFVTNEESIRGHRDEDTHLSGDLADVIVVRGETVTVYPGE